MRTIAVHRLTHLAVRSLTELARIVAAMGRSLAKSDETPPWSADAEVGSVRERGGR